MPGKDFYGGAVLGFVVVWWGEVKGQEGVINRWVAVFAVCG